MGKTSIWKYMVLYMVDSNYKELRKFYRRLKHTLTDDEYRLLIRLHRVREYRGKISQVDLTINKLRRKINTLKSVNINNEYSDYIVKLEVKLFSLEYEKRMLKRRIKKLVQKPYFETPNTKLFMNPYLNNYPLLHNTSYKSMLQFVYSELEKFDPFVDSINKIKTLKSMKIFNKYTEFLSWLDQYFLNSLDTNLLDDPITWMKNPKKVIKHLDNIKADLLEQFVLRLY